jgi:O-antigen/teichoic acid export membrane protein
MSEVIVSEIAERPLAKVKMLSLRRNFSWTLLGTVVYAGCQWGMLVVLAKTGTPETVGQFALGLAVTAPIFMLTNLNLRAVQATDAKSTYNFGDYLGLRVHATVIALVITPIVIFVTGYKYETVLVILAVAFFKSTESLSDTFYGLFQKSEKMDLTSKSMMVKGIVSLLTLASVYYLTHDLVLTIIVTSITKIIILVTYDYRNGISLLTQSAEIPNTGRILQRLHINLINRDILHNLALLSLPLGIVMMLNSLNTNIPRYLLERSFGERELGIFAAMAYLMVAGTTVISALGQSASPRLAKHFAAQNMAAFRRLLIRLVSIGLVGGALGIGVVQLGGKELLTFIYGPEYAVYADVLILIMVASALSYLSSFLGIAMTAARSFKIQMPITIFSLVVILSASWGLIPKFGMKGAAIAIICMFAAQIPFRSYVLHRLMKENSHYSG